MGATWSIVCGVLGGPFGRLPVGSAREFMLRPTYRGIIDDLAGLGLLDFNGLLIEAAKVYATTTLPAPTAADPRRSIPDAQSGLALVRAFWAGLQPVNARTHGLRLSGLGWEVTFREPGAECRAVDPALPPALAWTQPANRPGDDPRAAKVRDVLACLWELAAASPDRDAGRARLHELAERILPTEYLQQPFRPADVLAVFDPLNAMLSSGEMVYGYLSEIQQGFARRGEWKGIGKGRTSPKSRGRSGAAKRHTIEGDIPRGYDHEDLPAYETDPDRSQRILLQRHLERKAGAVDATLERWCHDRDYGYHELIGWRMLLERVRRALPAMTSADGVASRVEWRDRAARWLNTLGGYWPGSDGLSEARLPALEDGAWLEGFGKTLAMGEELFRELKGWTFSAERAGDPTGAGSTKPLKKLPKSKVQGELLALMAKGAPYESQRAAAALIDAHPSVVAEEINKSKALRLWAQKPRKAIRQDMNDGDIDKASLNAYRERRDDKQLDDLIDEQEMERRADKRQAWRRAR